MKNLNVQVDRIINRCGANLKIGDSFQITGHGKIVIPQEKGMCMFALQSLIPFLITKQHEDELPQDNWIAESEYLACPDPKGVVFKISTTA